MGYTSAVGMMLMDEVAGVCERNEVRFTEVRTDLGKVETDLDNARRWSGDVQEWVDGQERILRQLLASRDRKSVV